MLKGVTSSMQIVFCPETKLHINFLIVICTSSVCACVRACVNYFGLNLVNYSEWTHNIKYLTYVHIISIIVQKLFHTVYLLTEVK
jgi:hypothetical protein